jgi:acyl transferase domain-containing protein
VTKSKCDEALTIDLVDFREGRLQPVRECCKWPEHLSYRRASINSFGYGGANAHVILDSAETFFQREGLPFQLTWTLTPSKPLIDNTIDMIPTTNGASRGRTMSNEMLSPGPQLPTKRYLFVFSAHDEKTLRKNINAIASVVLNYSLSDIAYTLSDRRSRFSARTFAIASDASECVATLLQESKIAVSTKKSAEPTLAFMFTGKPFIQRR